MENSILANVRKLNWMLQESTAGVFSFDEICEIIGEMLDSNVYIVGLKGKIISVYYSVLSDSSAISDPETGAAKFPTEYNEEFLKLTDTRANLRGDDVIKIFKYDYDTQDKLHTVIPVIGGGQRWGTLVLARYSPEFSDEDLAVAEFAATVVGLEIQRRKSIEETEAERKRSVVNMAIGTLSYSELEAVQQVFSELGGSEGLLVASKIADKSGITRSVIVNALRKLESAGVIESRSLGMKGTHIKVLNDKFYEELAKTAV